MGLSCACFLFKHMYSLHTFDGQKLAFPSMAAVLHHLEDFTLGSNPYASHVAECHIEHDGIRMPLFMAPHYHVMAKIPASPPMCGADIFAVWGPSDFEGAQFKAANRPTLTKALDSMAPGF